MTTKGQKTKDLVFVLLLVMFIPTTATAVEVTILGPTSATIVQGGAFSIDLAVDNPSMVNTPGFDVTVSGLAAAGADVTAGMAATGYFCGFVFPGTGCLNGLTALVSGFWWADDLSRNFTPGHDSLLAVNLAGAQFSSADGSLDLGVANDRENGTHSPLDAHVELVASVVGLHEIVVGGDYSDGMNVFDISSSIFTLTVLPIPEPGTALLVGLGLAGLATVPRRRASGAGGGDHDVA